MCTSPAMLNGSELPDGLVTSVGHKLLLHGLQKNASDNVVVLPRATCQVLGLLQLAGAKKTEDEISQFLGTKRPVVLKPIQGGRSESSKKPAILEKSSLWLAEWIQTRKGFVKAATESYGLTIETIDYSKPTAADSIAKWLNDSSLDDNSLPPQKVLPATNADTCAILLTTFSASGSWVHQADPSKTGKKDFQSEDGKVAPADFMTFKGEFPLIIEKNFKAIALPVKGSELRAVLVLPSEGTKIVELIQQFLQDGQRFPKKSFEATPTKIEIPKLDLREDKGLEEALIENGIKEAFSPTQADFSDAFLSGGQTNIYLSQFRQAYHVRLDERGLLASGTVAAELQIETASFYPLVFDRPFILVILTEDGNSTLLLAAIRTMSMEEQRGESKVP